MSDYRVRFRRGDSGAVVERRVHADSARAARAAVAARGHEVIDIADESGGGLSLEDPSTPPEPRQAFPAGGDVVALLRSIDERLGRVERSTIVTQPRTTIGWGILASCLLAGFVLAVVGIVSALIGLGSAWLTPQ